MTILPQCAEKCMFFFVGVFILQQILVFQTFFNFCRHCSICCIYDPRLEIHYFILRLRVSKKNENLYININFFFFAWVFKIS